MNVSYRTHHVALLRAAIVATTLMAWEALAASGLLFRDVVPSLAAIGRAIGRVLAHPEFYANLLATAGEIGAGLAIGGLGQLINELAERYDLPGTYGAICFVILASVVFFDLTARLERWLRPNE